MYFFAVFFDEKSYRDELHRWYQNKNINNKNFLYLLDKKSFWAEIFFLWHWEIAFKKNLFNTIEITIFICKIAHNHSLEAQDMRRWYKTMKNTNMDNSNISRCSYSFLEMYVSY